MKRRGKKLFTQFVAVNGLRKSGGKMASADHTSVIVLQALKTYSWVFWRGETLLLLTDFPWFVGVYIWFKRNAVSLKQASLLYSQIYSDSLARRHEFHLAAEFMVQPAVISRPNFWLPPQPPFYKVNFDGALF